MNKKKNKMNKKIIKNLGSNFILWILIIIISLTVLQYVTTNTKTINISYKTFHDIVDTQNENIDNIIIEGRKSYGTCSPECFNPENQEQITNFTVTIPEVNNEIVDKLIKLGINVEIKDKTMKFAV